LYRPLLLLMLALESLLFGDWLAGYHLVNILLQILATILVYGFIRQLFLACNDRSPGSAIAALLAAAIFAVHPIHAEVVNSIFNRSEIIVSIGIVGGMWWAMQTLESQPTKAWLGLSLIYLLVLLFRESGIALPALMIVVIWLTSSDPWWPRLKKCLPVLWLLIPLGIYLFMRSHALAAITGSDNTPLAQQSEQVIVLEGSRMTFDPGRIPLAIGMWFDALKLMLWPHPLQVYYDRSQAPDWLLIGAQGLLASLAMAAAFRGRKGYLLGLLFFYIALLPSSRIIGEPRDLPNLADRLLYLPSVGLAIVLAFGMKDLLDRLNVRVVAIATVVVISVLMPLTWARNALWSDEVDLLEDTYRGLSDKIDVLNPLLAAYQRAGNVSQAARICDRHAAFIRTGSPMGVHCGTIYRQLGRWRDAEQAYLAVATNRADRRGTSFAHMNLATLYVQLKRNSEAEQHFELAIAAEGEEFLKEYFRAIELLQLHPMDREKMLEAKGHLERALQLQPQHSDSRADLKKLNEQLGQS